MAVALAGRARRRELAELARRPRMAVLLAGRALPAAATAAPTALLAGAVPRLHSRTSPPRPRAWRLPAAAASHPTPSHARCRPALLAAGTAALAPPPSS